MTQSLFVELQLLTERHRPALVKELHLVTGTDAFKLLEQLRAIEAAGGIHDDQ